MLKELTATVAETRANFSKIANTVRETGKSVTVFKNSKPWVVIAPIDSGHGDHIPYIDWSLKEVVKMDSKTRTTLLPEDWDNPEEDGLYDDIV